jgi:hypothetical protein
MAGFLLTGFARADSITGQYLEARNAEMWSGPCDHNAQIGLVGDRAIMVWKVNQGAHNNVCLDGLSVVAIVHADGTFGVGGKLKTQTVFVVDGRADKVQREALMSLAKKLAGDTIQQVVAVKSSPIQLDIDHAHRSGYSRLDAGVAKVRTRRMMASDHSCASERMVFPVLAQVEDEYGAYALENEYSGRQFPYKYADSNACSAVIAKFTL